MALTSLQACMDSSDWFQGTIHEEAGMDSSSSPSGDILTCTRPLIERRIRPQHEQNPKCPRCDSAHTKFCYYNNYSLTQPRYFCKTCRRYWTKGGTLRNIPVGGGCRKNKKASSKKTSDRAVPNQHHLGGSSLSENPTSLQLSFPNAQFLDHGNFLGNQGDPSNANFMSTRFNMMLENNVPIDFMDNKYEALVGHGELGMVGGFNDINYQGLTTNFGMSHHDAINNGTLMDNSHRLMLPYESIHEHQSTLDVKPNPRLLSLDWNEQVCSEAGKDTFGYLGGLGSWTGLMNGYGSSSTNPLSLN